MKTIGIVGGIGPESTIEYYRFLIAAWRERVPDGSNPPILINSIDLKSMLGMIGAGQLDEVTGMLSGAIEQLARGGAEFALLASNTPHIVFDRLAARARIPLLSIVEAAAAHARARGLRKPALFGTRFTMQGRFFPEVFTRTGIALAVPRPEEQIYIHDKYMNELLNNQFLPDTRAGLVAIVERMRAEEGIDGVVLAGTELPLILRDAPGAGVPFLDTTRIHVEAAVARMVGRG
ncbi:MAG: amino acid racemase [Acidobacteriales bacterium]|nr:amino acid racemase [Terriglobales bacterium]